MSGPGPLGIVILAHAHPEQLALLISELAHPAVRCYLHVDARAGWAPFAEALDPLDPGAYRLLPRHPTRWGGPELVDASLEGIEAAVEDGCHHVLQISGQDLPLWPAERLVRFFRENRGRSFVEHFPLPDDRWRSGGRLRTDCYTFTVLGRRETRVPPEMAASLSWKGRLLNALLGVATAFRPARSFPAYAEPYGGSQWWNLDRAAACWILDFLAAHPDYRRYHRHTLIPDEIFFQSILLGTDFAERHDVIDDALRYERWSEGSSHPDRITEADFPALVEAGVPFGRKVDLETARAFRAWRAGREEAHG